jgi:DNA-directed RNA polymerase specialized sigma24 family protein
MVKPDPYGDWVLFRSEESEARRSGSPDDELIAAAREAWPHVLAHAQKEFHQRGLGSDSPTLAAQVWEGVLRTISKARQRNSPDRPAISNLQSYLIVAFHRRFNKALLREQKRIEVIELISSSVEFERIESARDASWIEELEGAITIREITDRMDEWTRKVWQARQYGYTWDEIAEWLGTTAPQAKAKFQYGLEKTRANIIRLMKRTGQKKSG